MTKPEMKRKFVITNYDESSRRISFTSAADVRELLKGYGGLYSSHHPDQYVLYVSELYDFFEILDFLRTRQLLLNGIQEYVDREEKPFDWIEFIETAVSYLEDQVRHDRPEPESFADGSKDEPEPYFTDEIILGWIFVI